MHAIDTRVLRGSAAWTGLAAIVAVLAGLLADGGQGALGAAVGAVLVILFFGISVAAVSYAASISPQLIFGAAMLSYVTKILVLFALLGFFKNTTAWNPTVFGYAILALTIVWLAAEIRLVVKTKMLYVDPDETAAAPARAAAADDRGGSPS